MIAGAEHSGKLAMMLMGGGILAIVSLWRPLICLSIYMASLGLDYLLGVAGFGTSSLFSVGQGTLIILTAISGWSWWRRQSPLPFLARGFFQRIAFFSVAVLLSAFFGIWPPNSLFKALVLVAMSFLPFVLFVLIDRPSRLNWLLWSVGLGVTLSAIIGCLQYAGKLETIDSEERGTTDDKRGVVMEYRANGGGSVEGRRYAGPTGNANGYGVVLMGGIPVLYYLASSRRSWTQRLIAAAALGTCGFALLLTMSRTHICGFLLFLILVAAFNRARNWALQMVAWLLALVALGGFWVALSQVEGARDRLMKGGEDTSSDARMSVMLGGLKAWSTYPLLGIGLNNTEVAGFNENGNASHDLISTLFGELGGLGAMAFGMVVWQAFKLLPTRSFCEENGAEQLIPICSLVKASLLVCVVCGFGDPVVDGRPFWIWIGMCAILHRLTIEGAYVAEEWVDVEECAAEPA
jgi:hypothetical protein